MTKKYKKELSLEKLAALPDEAINYTDITELDETFWKNAKYISPFESCTQTVSNQKAE